MTDREQKVTDLDDYVGWTCHICGRRRPDSKISVYTTRLAMGGKVVGQQNVRYCNDKDSCYEGAKKFDFTRKSSDDS